MTKLIAFILWLAVIVLSIGGWIANIVKLCNHTGFGIEEMLRVIGIFAAPLGVVMGYL